MDYYINKYYEVSLENEFLKIKIPYFSIGKGTRLLSFLKNRNFYFEYWVDFDRKKIIDKNLFGGEYDISDEELEKIENRYYWKLKRN